MTCGHHLIFCLHAPMVNGGRTRSRNGPASKITIYGWSTRQQSVTVAIDVLQDIPVRFLFVVLSELRQGRLVRSVRGPDGG